ncbi:hypothetical protein [Methylocapsa sp. S129]|uniref:hypothetical protein n=1 Tax=Methylocapsa sp. S129 TaxID=1641869 RepID=UPI00131D4DE4|nr:hypothetical protein [Methylocapsa sp. S129]
MTNRPLSEHWIPSKIGGSVMRPMGISQSLSPPDDEIGAPLCENRFCLLRIDDHESCCLVGLVLDVGDRATTASTGLNKFVNHE